MNPIFQLQRRGYVTLQIPEVSIELRPTGCKYEHYHECDDHPDWFWRISYTGGIHICMGKGFLHFSKVGYLATKVEMQKAFEL